MGRIHPLMGVGWLFLFMICKESAPSLATEKFGCTFDDDDLNLRLEFPAKPTFSHIHPGNVKRFTSEAEFVTFTTNIQNIYREVVNLAEFDSLIDYIGFYQAYKRERIFQEYTDFHSFYQHYPVNFLLNRGPGGPVIALMNRIVAEYPELTQSSYFITKAQDYDETLRYEIYRNRHGTRDLPEIFQHDQVAAIIKYIREYTEGNSHYEYILLDPEIGATRPIYFVENDVRTIEDNHIRFKLALLGQSGMATNIMMATIPEAAGSSQGPRLYHVYFFERPYCSFVETTLKPNLLKPDQSIRHNLEAEEYVKVVAQVAHERSLYADPSTQNFQMILNKVSLLSLNFAEKKNAIKTKVKRARQNLDNMCLAMRIETDCLNYWAEIIETLQEIWDDVPFKNECQSALETLRNTKTEDQLSTVHPLHEF